MTSRLKCRGQVLDTTQVVVYEVTIKELGYDPAPYAIAEALIYADGKPVVDIGDLSIRFSGLTRTAVEALWKDQAPDHGARKPAVYDYNKILAYSQGDPSEAFGAPYAVFDNERRIARLPRPPYQFLDRVTAVAGEAWKCVAGATAETQYDVPPDGWYFDANNQASMPFAVLLEIALQPCGWLAAYVGSALTSETDLKFRNLGGKATQYAAVTPDTGTLTSQVRLTNVSLSGGMIIQHFDLKVLGSAGVFYEGTTYFGFFSADALADQVGIREAAPYAPADAEVRRGEAFPCPAGAPGPSGDMQMLDEITLFAPEGGPAGLGFIRGTKRVDPEEWFFQAHFYQDPVCPGSLGLESFLQLMKVAAVRRWGLDADARFQAVALDQPHEWVYRGQIIPSDALVTVEAVISAADDETRLLRADGFLSVDGRLIYEMKDFTLQVAAQ